jgi:hypothetical protein
LGAVPALCRVVKSKFAFNSCDGAYCSSAEVCEGMKRFWLGAHYFRSSRSSARGVPVNLEHCNIQGLEQSPVARTQGQEVTDARLRIERCEFEQLLLRAMEILNARDLEAQLGKTV